MLKQPDNAKILAATRLEISHDERTGNVPPLFAGQPISAILTVSTSFHWAPAEDSHFSKYLMRFDVEEMTKDWLVSGRKRGEFVAKVRSSIYDLLIN